MYNPKAQLLLSQARSYVTEKAIGALPIDLALWLPLINSLP